MSQEFEHLANLGDFRRNIVALITRYYTKYPGDDFGSWFFLYVVNKDGESKIMEIPVSPLMNSDAGKNFAVGWLRHTIAALRSAGIEVKYYMHVMEAWVTGIRMDSTRPEDDPDSDEWIQVSQRPEKEEVMMVYMESIDFQAQYVYSLHKKPELIEHTTMSNTAYMQGRFTHLVFQGTAPERFREFIKKHKS